VKMGTTSSHSMVMDKNRIWIISLAAFFFILAVVFIGLWHADEIRDIVSRQFNEEQLVIARNVAGLIEKELDFLEKELLLISTEIAADPFNPDKHQASLQKSLSRVIRSGARSILVADTAGSRAYHYVLDAPWKRSIWFMNHFSSFPSPSISVTASDFPNPLSTIRKSH
jgi:hypothetical protein